MKVRYLLYFIFGIYDLNVNSQIIAPDLEGQYEGTYSSSSFETFPYPHWQNDTGTLIVQVQALSDTAFKLQWNNVDRNCILHSDSSFFTDNPYSCCVSNNRFFDSIRISFSDGSGSAFGGGLTFDGIKILTGISENEGEGLFSVSPNPFHTETKIESKKDFISAELQIFNAMGVKVNQQKLNKQTTMVNRESLTNGIYFFQIINGTGELNTTRVVIE